MRSAIIVLFFFSSLVCQADMGSCYLFKVKFKTTSGNKFEGYMKYGNYTSFNFHSKGVTFNSDQKNIEIAYTNEEELEANHSDRLLSYNAELTEIVLNTSSVVIWSDVISFKVDGTEYSQLIGIKKKMSSNEIERLHITYISSCLVGQNIETKLDISDKDWIENAEKALVNRLELGIKYTNCHYKTCFFSKSDSIISDKLMQLEKLYRKRLIGNEFPDNESETIDYKSINQKIEKIISWLRAKKVLILSECSC
ncbi:MAG: hypothetical protein ABJH72_09745 [Reichenbachiella sp.]|uniref:hypothetical protein n=1 Tax=Reichenbachiella sp. TaxID=2184521 RepID=UPI0032668BD8